MIKKSNNSPICRSQKGIKKISIFLLCALVLSVSLFFFYYINDELPQSNSIASHKRSQDDDFAVSSEFDDDSGACQQSNEFYVKSSENYAPYFCIDDRGVYFNQLVAFWKNGGAARARSMKLNKVYIDASNSGAIQEYYINAFVYSVEDYTELYISGDEADNDLVLVEAIFEVYEIIMVNNSEDMIGHVSIYYQAKDMPLLTTLRKMNVKAYLDNMEKGVATPDGSKVNSFYYDLEINYVPEKKQELFVALSRLIHSRP